MLAIVDFECVYQRRRNRIGSTYGPQLLDIAELNIVLGDLLEDTQVGCCVVGLERHGSVSIDRVSRWSENSSMVFGACIVWPSGANSQHIHDGGG